MLSGAARLALLLPLCTCSAPELVMPRFRLNPRARAASVVSVTNAHPRFGLFVHDPRECIRISASLLRNRAWEPKMVASAIAALRAANASGRAESFLDVGANLGVWSLSAAAAGFRAVAIEPMRYNTELLEESVRQSGFGERYTLFKMAAVARESGETMCVRPFNTSKTALTQNRGNGQLAPASGCAGSTTGAELVAAHTIDSQLQSTPALAAACFAAIKVDVEGHEAEALAGARRVFEGPCPPCRVFVEAQKALQRGGGEPAVFGRLNALGYSCRGGRLIGGMGSDFMCVLGASRGGDAPRCGTADTGATSLPTTRSDRRRGPARRGQR